MACAECARVEQAEVRSSGPSKGSPRTCVVAGVGLVQKLPHLSLHSPHRFPANRCRIPPLPPRRSSAWPSFPFLHMNACFQRITFKAAVILVQTTLVSWEELDRQCVNLPAACFSGGVALRFLPRDEGGGPGRFFPFALAAPLDEAVPIAAPDDAGRLTHDVGFLRQYSWMLTCTTQSKRQ